MYSTFQPGISTHLIIQERMFSTNTEIAVGKSCKAIKVDLFTLQSHNQGLFLFVSRKDICDRATDTEKFLERAKIKQVQHDKILMCTLPVAAFD